MNKTVKHIRILAMDARVGMIQCYSNPRFDHVIDDVDLTRDGEVRIQYGNFTAVDWFRPDEYIWVQEN